MTAPSTNALVPQAAGRPGLRVALVAIVLVVAGLVLAGAWRVWGTGSQAVEIEYITEKGAGSSEGALNSPLHVRLRVPWSTESPENALAAVTLELLDEGGNRAQFGGVAFPPLAMRWSDEPGVWVYDGSVPSLPGSYTARVHMQAQYDNARSQIVELREPRLRALPETEAPLRSGYIFSLAPDLWLLSSDGLKQRRLTFVERAARYPDEPAWSPDGRTIAFAYQPSIAPSEFPTSDIWTLRPDGTDLKRLVEPGQREVLADPAWSADGKYLYFAVDTLPDAATSVATPHPQDRRIDRLDLSTGERKQFVLGAQMPATGPPSGELLAVEDTPPPDPGGTPGQQLAIVRTDGTRKAVLVGPRRYPQIYAPRLSPDGQWVVFAAPNGRPGIKDGAGFLEWLLLFPQVAHAHDIPWDLFLVSAKGGRVEQITSMDEDQPHPVWLNDRTLSFIGKTGLYRLTISEGGRAVGKPSKLREGGDHSTLTWHGP